MISVSQPLEREVVPVRDLEPFLTEPELIYLKTLKIIKYSTLNIILRYYETSLLYVNNPRKYFIGFSVDCGKPRRKYVNYKQFLI